MGNAYDIVRQGQANHSGIAGQFIHFFFGHTDYLLICPDIRRCAFFVGLLATSSPSGPAGA